MYFEVLLSDGFKNVLPLLADWAVDLQAANTSFFPDLLDRWGVDGLLEEGHALLRPGGK